MTTPDRTCSADGCVRPLIARTLCTLHYQRAKKAGTLPPLRERPQFCSAEGCTDPPKSRGMCPTHYGKWRWRNPRTRQMAMKRNRERWANLSREEQMAESRRVEEYRRTPQGRASYRAYQKKWKQVNPRSMVPVVPFTQAQLAAKVAYWGGLCWICRGSWAEWDHLKPVSAGGLHILSNFRPICRSCNARKSARWPLSEVLALAERIRHDRPT